MGDNEVKELFGYLSKDGEVSADRVKQLFTSIYREAKPAGPMAGTVTRNEFESAYAKATQADKIDDELLYLFYNLDREK